MTDADTAAEEQDEKAAIASRRLSVALAMHSDLVAEKARIEAEVVRNGGCIAYSEPVDLAETAVARADALLAELEKAPWPSSDKPSMSPRVPT